MDEQTFSILWVIAGMAVLLAAFLLVFLRERSWDKRLDGWRETLEKQMQNTAWMDKTEALAKDVVPVSLLTSVLDLVKVLSASDKVDGLADVMKDLLTRLTDGLPNSSVLAQKSQSNYFAPTGEARIELDSTAQG